MKRNRQPSWISLLLLPVLALMLDNAGATTPIPVSFHDSDGQAVRLPDPPRRVVSLVPSITEILIDLGAGERLVGATLPLSPPPEIRGPEVVGGFLSPDFDQVEKLTPDLIFHSDLHRRGVQRLQATTTLVRLAPSSIGEGLTQIELLSRIFGREAQAEAIVAEQRRQLAVITDKTGKISTRERLRTMRLMGRSSVMTPGDDSFQQEFITAAGGLPPRLEKNGQVVAVSLAEWQRFNPQALYGCGGDRELLPLLQRPRWREVEAVRHNRIHFFPCELTCRISTHPGDFVSWLAASLYPEEFSDPATLARTEQVIARRPLALDLPYVAEAEIIESDIMDFRNKTLTVTLKQPMRVMSTLEGWREEVRVVANHFFPPPAWGLGHRQGLEWLRQSTMNVLGLSPRETAMLFTGADMDHLALVRKSHRALEVTALVTAGVRGNAMRMGSDQGLFYEPDGKISQKRPGTINILLLGNCRLSPGAMSRAIITATEAKSAALQDLDIRSSETGSTNQATGTGTDNILVVEGAGPPIDGSGGHTKLGELIAAAVHQAVGEAIRRQNGMTGDRSILERLQERGIELAALYPAELRPGLEHLLIIPRHAAFVDAAMAIGDAHAQGRIADLTSFRRWCETEAQAVAGEGMVAPAAVEPGVEAPPLTLALDALARGLAARSATISAKALP